MESTETRSYWIFQAKPERYDLDKELVPGATERWLLTRYRDRVTPNDIVYFWRAGRQAGLVGWGEVASVPQTVGAKAGKTAREDVWVPVTYRVRLTERIGRERLTGGDDRSIGFGLSGLHVLRSQAGTNFKVTLLEAVALNRLIATHDEIVPPDPPGMKTRQFSPESLLPLSFGRTVTQIIESAIDHAEGHGLDGAVLLDAVLRLMNESEQAGTIGFLRGFLAPALADLPQGRSALRIASVHKTATWQRSMVSWEALEILETARLLAIWTTRRESMGVRHFFAGLLQSGSEGTLNYLDELCHQSGRTFGELVDRFIETTAVTFKDDDTATWVRSFRSGMDLRLERGQRMRPRPAQGVPAQEFAAPVEGAKPEGETEESGRAFLAEAFGSRLNSDRPSGDDHMRIQAEVAALAHTFARCPDDAEAGSPSERPTIALGLFGRWGSGKSFFMTELREKIQTLTADPPENGRRRYCKRIEQIEFNAWHYKEANLWASLVHHIFDTLQTRFEREDKQEEFRALIEQLDMSMERRKEILAQLAQKESQREALADAIAEKEQQIEERLEGQTSLIGMLPGQLAKNTKTRENLLEILPKAAGFLGLNEADLRAKLQNSEQTADDLLALIRNTGAAAAQGQSLGRMILYSSMSWWLLAIIAAALTIYFGALMWIGPETFWDDLIGKTGQLVALAAGPLTLILTRLKAASEILSQVSGVEATLKDDVRQEIRQKDAMLAASQAALERLSKEILHDKEQQVKISDDIRNIEEKLSSLGSSQSLVDFINERAHSGDYRDKLGILALIRHDFETLSKLMTGEKENSPSGSDHRDSDSQTEAGGGKTARKPAKLPQIDRIILYVDDLDRVSDSQQVLKVMEAVHLLLSFPLFNVVVAVDEWWAAQSVRSHYKEYFAPAENGEPTAALDKAVLALLARNQDGAQGGNGEKSPNVPTDSRKATPREFLEKVFQICFWVRPLGQELAERLIEGTVRQENKGSGGRETAPLGGAAVARSSGRGTSEQPNAGAGPAGGASRIPGADGNAEPDSPGSDARTDTAADGKDRDEDPDAEGGRANGRNGQIVILDEDFAISSDELVTLQALARVVGRSPRTIKRFINTYRLLKAILIHQLAEVGDGEDSTDRTAVEARIREDHAPLMFLLAIQVGRPDVAVKLFEQIDNALSQDDGSAIEAVLSQLQGAPVDPDIDEAKWHDALKALLAVLRQQDSVLQLNQIASFDPWLEHAARFGFEEWEPRSERMWH